MVNLFVTTFYGYALVQELYAFGCKFTVTVNINGENHKLNQYLPVTIDTDMKPSESLVLKEGKDLPFTNFKTMETYYSGDFLRDVEHLRDVLNCL